MIIDFHTHIFPDHIAPKAMEVLKKNSNDCLSFTQATLSDTELKMEQWGIEKYVVLNIATNIKQQKNVNDFAIANNTKKCIMFGSVHPFAPDALQELDRIKAAGLKGVKLHSEYQNFNADDKNVFQIYEKIKQLNLLLVLHGGTDVAYQNSPVRCSPKAVRKIADNFKDLKIIMAHLGGYKETQSTLQYLAKREIYLDTSVADIYFTRENAEKIIKEHGEDFLLFGSDCPWADVGQSVKFIDSLNIPSSKKEALFYKNAKFLLNI